MPPRRRRNHADLHQQIPAKDLSTLLAVSSALASSLELNVVLQTAIDSAVKVLGLDTGAVYILNDSKLYLGATTPPLRAEEQWLLLQPESLVDHPHLNRALAVGEPFFLPDAPKAKLTASEAAICAVRGLRTILFIPLLLEKQSIGALILGTTGAPRQLSDYEIDLSRVLSHQISLGVANAKLFRSVQQSNDELTRSYDATLLGWSKALEMRDQETNGHTQRVTRLTEALARRMGIREPEIDHIRRGALLHDIGKMSIPDSILKKPGALDPCEVTVMRMHPVYAQQFLSQIDYLAPALDIPYYHHERWDGSGYPRGLAGEAIPLAARIFAVVDVYDALTSDRPYRKAWPKAEAVRYIREQAGTHFDPRVAAVFLSEVARADE